MLAEAPQTSYPPNRYLPTNMIFRTRHAKQLELCRNVALIQVQGQRNKFKDMVRRCENAGESLDLGDDFQREIDACEKRVRSETDPGKFGALISDSGERTCVRSCPGRMGKAVAGSRVSRASAIRKKPCRQGSRLWKLGIVRTEEAR